MKAQALIIYYIVRYAIMYETKCTDIGSYANKNFKKQK